MSAGSRNAPRPGAHSGAAWRECCGACSPTDPKPPEGPGSGRIEPGMEERSEEQVISRLFDLENDGVAAQRAELTGERFLSLIQDPENGLGYVFQHGLHEPEGAEVPPGTGYWEYPTLAEANKAYSQLLDEDRRPADVVETHTDEALTA